MPNRTSPICLSLAAVAPHGLIAAALCLSLGAFSCARSTGPEAQSAVAPTPESAPAESPEMVPAAGVDTGRRAPDAPEPSSDARAVEPEPGSPAAGADVAGDTKTEPGVVPSEGAKQDVSVDGAVVPPRSPLAALVAPNVAFMLNYQGSGARTLAEAACDEKVKGDLQKRAECLKEGREAFKADVLLFDPLGKDRYSLTIYSRSGSTLKEVFASTVLLQDTSEQNVTMRFIGGQRGQRPIFGGKGTVTLVVATDSTLAIEDPRYGSLPYSAKVGLVQNR